MIGNFQSIYFESSSIDTYICSLFFFFKENHNIFNFPIQVDSKSDGELIQVHIPNQVPQGYGGFGGFGGGGAPVMMMACAAPQGFSSNSAPQKRMMKKSAMPRAMPQQQQSRGFMSLMFGSAANAPGKL